MADPLIPEDVLPAFFDPLITLLSSALPSPLYSLALSLLTNLHALCLSLFRVATVILRTSPAAWDAEQLLPPLITLLMAYLALVSFYRTAGWMVRTTLALVKWGVLLTSLGAAAGYFLANGHPDGAGAGLGGVGGLLLGLLGGQGQGQNNAANRRARAPTAPRPASWETWDRHNQWKDAEDRGRDPASEGVVNVQEVVANIMNSAGNAIRESGWWGTAMDAADKFVQRNAEAESKGKSKKGEKKTSKKKTEKNPRSR